MVEDHLDTLNTTARLLRLEGYPVYTALGFAEALGVAARHPFDILVADIGLADGDGCDLMKTLASLYRIKGIALTAHGFPVDVERCTQAGFSMHMLKPVSIVKVTAALREVWLGFAP